MADEPKQPDNQEQQPQKPALKEWEVPTLTVGKIADLTDAMAAGLNDGLTSS